jgi:HEAT repeat protein
MAVTMEQVRSQLTPIEPKYAEAAQLGPEAMPHLERLAAGPDLLLATRAVHLASLIGGDGAAHVLLDAAKNASAEVRVQAAAGARNLSGDAATRVLLIALRDSDVGVRNVALKSVRPVAARGELSGPLRERVAAMLESDPEQFLRESAGALLKG